jgi:hypothetical protein
MRDHNDDQEKRDLVKRAPSDIDDGGFAGWTDEVEGDDRPQGAGVIQGTKLKFKDAKWFGRDEKEIPSDLELAAVAVGRYLQKWEDKKPIETKSIAAGELFPDVDAMNEKIPRKEWVDGPNGEPHAQGPYQTTSVFYFVDLKTMDQYSFPAPTVTIGSSIAVRELRKTIVWMQKYRGANVYPIVKLSKTWMKTRYAGGGRMRPHFEILRWVRLGGESVEAEALPPPSSETAQQQLDNFGKKAEPELPLKKVQEPTLQEEIGEDLNNFNDPLPEDLGEPKKAAAPLPPARRNHKKSTEKSAPKKAPPKNILGAG